MTHVRTQIRHAFRDALVAGLSADHAVFASRKYKWNIETGKPLVDIRFSNDQTQSEQAMGDDERWHTASLYVRVQRAAMETDLDDLLDADEVAVVESISAVDWSPLLTEEPELMQVNFADSAETGVPVGAIVIRYDVEYRIDRTNPEIVIDGD